jgi:hypothetical protein
MYSFQELTSVLLTNASAQLGVQYTPMRVTGENGTTDVINLVQELIRMDPAVVIVDVISKRTREFLVEVRLFFLLLFLPYEYFLTKLECSARKIFGTRKHSSCAATTIRAGPVSTDDIGSI